MWEINDGDLVRYRCHVAHAYTAELMSIALDENLTRALASALRALDERIGLAERMWRQANQDNRPHAGASWAEKAQEFREQADIIRQSIQRVDQIAKRIARDALSADALSGILRPGAHCPSSTPPSPARALCNMRGGENARKRFRN